MRKVKSMSCRLAYAYIIALSIFGICGLMPRPFLAVDPPSAKSQPGEALHWTDKSGAGKLVSYQDGALTVRRLDGTSLRWKKLPEQTKFIRFDTTTEKFNPIDGSEAFHNVKLGTWIQVYLVPGDPTARIGEEDRRIRGTFISFKDERLLIQGKDFNLKYFKRYGNTVHFKRFADDLPAYESIDGGEYKLVGMANQVLRDIKEGTLITLHDEGEGNFTFLDIGAKKR